MSNHKKLCEAAEKAIDEVFSDDGVSLEQTLSAMNELAAAIDIKIDCLKADIKRREK
jgi:hypothetical protein